MKLNLSKSYELEPWQADAVAAWSASCHPTLGPRHGIFDVFTGAGKTVLACAAGKKLGRDVRGMFKQTPRLLVLLKETADGLFACGRLDQRLTVKEVGQDNAEFAEVDLPVMAPTPQPTPIVVPTHFGMPGESAQQWLHQRRELAAEIALRYPGNDAWFDIVKRAFLAFKDEDSTLADACEDALRRRVKGRRYGIPWLEVLRCDVPSPVSPYYDPFPQTYPEIMEAACRAYACGQTTAVRRCRDELARQACGRARLRGLADALSILTGETRIVSRGGGAAF